MSTSSRVLIVGLKGSGKTTFLAALWHLLESAEVSAGLVLDQLQPDRAYLNRIRDSWLRCEETGRTSLRVEERLSLAVTDAFTGNNADLTLPDMSGESIGLQWVDRKATSAYAEFASGSDGVILFVHPDSVKRSGLIAPRDHEAGDQPARNPSKITAWSPSAAPTQVQLVEIMQFVCWLRTKSDPLRVAIVISAWDLVQTSIEPSAWIERRLPLLHQYLLANSARQPVRFFGVSAFGGAPAKAAELQAHMDPSRRIVVQEGTDKPHHDISAPLKFVLPDQQEKSVEIR